MNWGESVINYENHLIMEKSLSANSVLAYINDIKKIKDFAQTIETKPEPFQIEKEHLKLFIEWLNDKKISERSQARIISSLKSFFRFLLSENVIKVDPSALLEAPRIGRLLPDVLTMEEIDKIIEAIDLEKPEGRRNKAMLETLYSCGIRVSELVNLKVSNLFFRQGYIKVEGKGEKERLVPVSETAKVEILFYMNDYRKQLNIAKSSENILFLNRRGGKLTRVMIFTIIKNLAKKAGIKKKISPHTFRHTFASHLVNGGADLRAVQEMLGHESILTTEIYTHLDNEYLRSTVNQFHPRS